MNINIKAINMELTDAIRGYVETKVKTLERFLKRDDVFVQVEVGKITNHHKNGDVFKAEIEVTSAGHRFFALFEGSDLYNAIDEAKEEIVREITDSKDKKKTLFKRGALSIKKMLKGISKRNPFTSKY